MPDRRRGLKLSRLHVCIGAVVHAVQHVRLTEHAIAPLRHGGRPVSTEAVVSLLALVLIYFSFAGLLWFHFVAHGYPRCPPCSTRFQRFRPWASQPGRSGRTCPAI